MDSQQALLRALMVERFGPPPYRRGPDLKEPPKVIAARRRVLVGIDEAKEEG